MTRLSLFLFLLVKVRKCSEGQKPRIKTHFSVLRDSVIKVSIQASLNLHTMNKGVA